MDHENEQNMQDNMQNNLQEEDLLDRLHVAFGGEDGSFLGQLRGKMIWDQYAFDSLVRDMRDICELRQEAEMLERWLADGFWYLPHFVQSWTNHPDFPKDRIPMEARLANGLLEDLAHWFFTDDCPWENPDAWLQTVLPPLPERKPEDEADPQADSGSDEQSDASSHSPSDTRSEQHADDRSDQHADERSVAD